MRLFRSLFTRFMNLSLLKKTISGYIVIILLPVLVFGLLYIRQSTASLVRDYQFGRQQLLEEAYSNYTSRIVQIQYHFQLFQNNKPLLEYLQGYCRTPSEEIYSYLTDIRPLFSFLHSSLPHSRATVYHTRDVEVTLSNDVFYIDSTTPTQAELEADSGKWEFRPNYSKIYYTEKLLSSDYSWTVGYFRIELDTMEVLSPLLLNAPEDVYFFREGKWHSLEGDSISQLSGESDLSEQELNAADFTSGVYDNHLVNFILLPELDGYIATATPVSNATDLFSKLLPLLLLLFILVVLSVLYYMIVNSLSRRLINLRYHIKKTDFDHMIPHDDVGYSDEIGDVIRAFNKMILRVRDLLSDLNIAELKKKEADFYALQAQIKPHFIYNALETIRMTAVSNDDDDAADLTYSLGRFIRYNMSVGSDDSTLAREIENVSNYLQIYHVSLGEKLAHTEDIRCDIEGVKCPAFILQPLVENSIHHGLSSKTRALRIKISAWNDGEYVNVAVEDNGEGIPEERLALISSILEGEAPATLLTQSGHGIGLTNIYQRLRNYYGGKSLFRIEPAAGGGVVCRILIPRQFSDD